MYVAVVMEGECTHSCVRNLSPERVVCEAPVAGALEAAVHPVST